MSNLSNDMMPTSMSTNSSSSSSIASTASSSSSSSQPSTTTVIAAALPNFAPKKCWICLNIINLDETENRRLRELFFVNTHSNSNSNSSNNDLASFDYATNTNNNDNKQAANDSCHYIKLEPFTNKYLLAICKCRKKLAHLSCFNSYIDLKQNGNTNIDIYCTQCNYKYIFDYPYNSKI